LIGGAISVDNVHLGQIPIQICPERHIGPANSDGHPFNAIERRDADTAQVAVIDTSSDGKGRDTRRLAQKGFSAFRAKHRAGFLNILCSRRIDKLGVKVVRFLVGDLEKTEYSFMVRTGGSMVGQYFGRTLQ